MPFGSALLSGILVLMIAFNIMCVDRFAGTGWFTTLLLAIQLHETRKATMQMMKPPIIVDVARKRVIGLFCFCVLFIDCGAPLLSLAIGGTIMMVVIALIGAIVQIACSIYFVKTAVKMMSLVKTGGSSSKAALKRMGNLMALSSVFMFLIIAAALFLLLSTYMDVYSVFNMYFLLFVGRYGGAVVRVNAAKPKAKPAKVGPGGETSSMSSHSSNTES